MATQAPQVPAVPVPPPAPVPSAIVTELDQILLALEWIGFADQGQRTRISDDLLHCFADILALNEKEVLELSTSFSRRTVANGKIDFGIRQTKKLIHFLHWVQDAARTLYTATTNGYVQANLLCALTESEERADVRQQLRLRSDVRAKEASPVPLVSKNK